MPGVLWRRDPVTDPLPLVFDSPHSGVEIPDDFGFVCDASVIKGGADTYVDELYAKAPSHGATLIGALFPRAYIDANRDEADIDPSMLDAPWPGAVTQDMAEPWNGLIRSRTRSGTTYYERKLSVPEVQNRIERFYRPYHDALKSSLESLHDRFGHVWHINCHSYSRTNRKTSPPQPYADFVLGDRNGTTCAEEFTEFFADKVSELGYSVGINKPYAGKTLITRYSAPDQHRHSIQIEINKNLYLGKNARKKEAFVSLQRDVATLIGATSDYVRAKVNGR